MLLFLLRRGFRLRAFYWRLVLCQIKLPTQIQYEIQATEMKENITLFLCKEKSLTFETKMQFDVGKPVARIEQIGQLELENMFNAIQYQVYKGFCKGFFSRPTRIVFLESNIRKSVFYCRSSGSVLCLLGFDCSIQNLQKSKGPFEDKGKPHEILIVTTNGRQIRFSQLLHTRDT